MLTYNLFVYKPGSLVSNIPSAGTLKMYLCWSFKEVVWVHYRQKLLVWCCSRGSNCGFAKIWKKLIFFFEFLFTFQYSPETFEICCCFVAFVLHFQSKQVLRVRNKFTLSKLTYITPHTTTPSGNSLCFIPLHPIKHSFSGTWLVRARYQDITADQHWVKEWQVFSPPPSTAAILWSCAMCDCSLVC